MNARFFNVDPTRFALVSLGANANMLLHTIQARAHEKRVQQKRPLLQGISFVAPNKVRTYEPY